MLGTPGSYRRSREPGDGPLAGLWGASVLREGDIVFRMGDARTLQGMFPLSLFIAKATGSVFSHTGIVAIEEGSPVVYDCSSSGIHASRSRSGCSTASDPWA